MSLRDALNIMLQPQDGYSAGVNTKFGYSQYHGRMHNGIDLNYHNPDGSKLGQNGINMESPDIYTPVSGTVTKVDRTAGTIEITDNYGYKHILRHLNEITVEEGNSVKATDKIGTMGGRGVGDKNGDGIPNTNYEYDQHIHYEVQRPVGNGKYKYMDPEDYWNDTWQRIMLNYEGIKKNYTDAIGSAPPITRRDPLMVDLDGDGIETTNVKDGAYFDHDGNGFAEQTGWAGADDGLLVMDRNGDGIINDGKELFGDQTILSNGLRASNGFQALADLDSNKDGKIDAADSAFNNLKV